MPIEDTSYDDITKAQRRALVAIRKQMYKRVHKTARRADLESDIRAIYKSIQTNPEVLKKLPGAQLAITNGAEKFGLDFLDNLANADDNSAYGAVFRGTGAGRGISVAPPAPQIPVQTTGMGNPVGGNPPSGVPDMVSSHDKDLEREAHRLKQLEKENKAASAEDVTEEPKTGTSKQPSVTERVSKTSHDAPGETSEPDAPADTGAPPPTGNTVDDNNGSVWWDPDAPVDTGAPPPTGNTGREKEEEEKTGPRRNLLDASEEKKEGKTAGTKVDPREQDKYFAEQLQKAEEQGPLQKSGGPGWVEGKGVRVAGGGFSVPQGAGLTAGGQIEQTKVETDVTEGDVITEGPQAVSRADNSLRSTFQLATGEEVKAINENVQSDFLFETFNYHPVPNPELGIDNPLEELNRQHEFIRFNPTGALFQPRAYTHPDHPAETGFDARDHMKPRELGAYFKRLVDPLTATDAERKAGRKRPLSVFSNDTDNHGSLKTAKKEHTSHLTATRIRGEHPFIPRESTVGSLSNVVPTAIDSWRWV